MLLSKDGSPMPIRSSAQELIEVVALMYCASSSDSIKLVERLLGFPIPHREYSAFYSSLNNNHNPLQVCISYKGNTEHSRVVIDPVANLALCALRFEKTKAILESHLKQADSDSLFQTWLWDSIEHWIPDNQTTDSQAKNKHARGYFWLGTDLQQKGTALYLTPRWIASAQQWDHASRWLNYFGIDASDMINQLSHHARLASIALEGRAANTGKIKIYWRLDSKFNLLNQPHALFQDDQIKLFLVESIENNEISKNGLLFSTSWNLSTGQIEEVKIDLCGHCLNKTQAQWNNLIRRLSAIFSFKLPNTKPYFDTGADIAFISFALDINLRNRFNLYWKPKG